MTRRRRRPRQVNERSRVTTDPHTRSARDAAAVVRRADVYEWTPGERVDGPPRRGRGGQIEVEQSNDD